MTLDQCESRASQIDLAAAPLAFLHMPQASSGLSHKMQLNSRRGCGVGSSWRHRLTSKNKFLMSQEPATDSGNGGYGGGGRRGLHPPGGSGGSGPGDSDDSQEGSSRGRMQPGTVAFGLFILGTHSALCIRLKSLCMLATGAKSSCVCLFHVPYLKLKKHQFEMWCSAYSWTIQQCCCKDSVVHDPSGWLL